MKILQLTDEEYYAFREALFLFGESIIERQKIKPILEKINPVLSPDFNFDAYKVVVDPTPVIYCNNQLVASFATEAEANIACRALNINRAKQAYRKNQA